MAFSSRTDDVYDKRMATPCKFADGISYEDFSNIAYQAAKKIKRIKDVTVSGTIIYCTVASQTGISDWDFRVDFNNWGHITGTYWKRSDNLDSNIPKVYGHMVSGEIHQLMSDRNIYLPDYSDYVDADEEIGTLSGLSYCKKTSFFKKVFSKGRYISSRFDSQKLLGEHAYLIVAMLKSNGFTNIKSIPIKDVTSNSNKYLFEVEQVVINGVSFFEEGDTFAEDVSVIITYHDKKEIAMPHQLNHFKRRNYIVVGDELQDMGFSNIYERKIKDLVTGWITKDGSVEQILVKLGNEEVPMQKDRLYEYDVEIIILYHTFNR